MIRQVHRLVLHGMLGASLLAACTAACAQSQASDTVYRLHGTVVDGRTGQPLARALVVSGDRRLATMTNSEGAFAIDVSVPAQADHRFGQGWISLRAEKPGYVTPPRPPSLPLNETTSSTEVALKLMPSAAIEGVVSTPPNGPENVQVTLLRRRVQEGLPNWLPQGMRRTNSRGEFRFGSLEPAEYTVMATAYSAGGPMRSFTEVTQQIPPVYLGDASNLSAAGKMNLHYGETARAEIHLHLATYYPVLVAVGGQGAQGNGGVSLRVVGAEGLDGFQFNYNPQERVAKGALPDGSYTVMISSFGPAAAFATIPIQVSGAAVHAGPVALAPMGSIEVHVHPEFSGSTSSVPLFTQVFLRPVDMGMNAVTGGSRPGQEQDFFIEDVQPGQYMVSAQPAVGYVAALSSGGDGPAATSTHRGCKWQRADDRYDASRRQRDAERKVISGDSPLPLPCLVYALPMSGGGRDREIPVAADGKFELQNLAPGSYLLLASGDPSLEIPYRDPEAMRAYEGKGSTITVAAGQSLSADVTLADAGDGDR